MFSFYGSKSKIAHLYPEPVHKKIIEPFAGSARYSLLYWAHDVQLYDLSDHVVSVWRYLIQASEKDVLSLPDVPSKVHLDTYKELSDAERYLIGFHLCRGKAKPRKVGHGQNSWARDKQRIADNLYKIRHWKIEQRCYCSIPNETATWFIDPPYRATQERPGNSDRYEHWRIDDGMLAHFITSRKGQTIACEGDDHGLPIDFCLLKETNANTNTKQVKKVNEYIYVKNTV